MVVPYVFPVAAAALLAVVAGGNYLWLFGFSPGAGYEGATFAPSADAGWWDAADVPLLPLHVALMVGLAENSDPLGRWLNGLSKT